MKTLYVSKGKFNVEKDAAAIRRREIAERLRRGEDVSITASGQVMEPDNPDIDGVRTLKAPEGKLAMETTK